MLSKRMGVKVFLLVKGRLLTLQGFTYKEVAKQVRKPYIKLY